MFPTLSVSRNPLLWDRKEGLPLKDAFQRGVSGCRLYQRGVCVGWRAGTSLPPFTTAPTSGKCQQAGEGGRRDRQAVNPGDAGAWAAQAQAPRQLFRHALRLGSARAGDGPLSGSSDWCSARSKREEAAKSGGEGSGAHAPFSDFSLRVLGADKARALSFPPEHLSPGRRPPSDPRGISGAP